ncbi:DUF1792 domain-containing protein [Candidatus Nomurabacteria bacterium]|nr:DUF1792 domain-containing protein [Candidatus Nomurabacteria bacterium]
MRQFIIWRNRFRKFSDYPAAVIPFLKKRLYYNWVADSYLPHYKDVKFLDYQETIKTLLEENKSFVRFGDDVFDMIQGIGLYFNDWRQKYEPDLANRLKEVLASSHPRLLVGFNPELILLTKEEFRKKGIPEEYQYWTHSKIFMKDYINPGQVYGSTLCFQERYNKDIDYGQLLNHLKSKHLVIVASNIQRFDNAALGLSTDYVEGPSSDAWSNYSDILDSVRKVLRKYPNDKVLVLSSLGPTTKVMTYDLTKEGYTVWDTGQLFDLALNKLK